MHFPTLSAQFFCFLFIISSASIFASAYDLLDPNGSINIKWDIMSWTPDGYVATVTISNLQMYRQITRPVCTLGWTWANTEVIWSMVGAEATDQGDCSNFKGNNIPHSCEKSPAIVDLFQGAPQDQHFPGCCRGGVLSSLVQQDQAAAVSSFQRSVGHSSTSKKTVKLPKDFYFLGPGPGYTYSAAIVVPSSAFLSSDGRRKTRAMMTWTITCTYSLMLISKNPSCCVSLSSFYNPVITPCPACACGCPNINCNKLAFPLIHSSLDFSCRGDSKISTNSKLSLNDNSLLLQCTKHMCPIQVHWHVKMNYRKYWRVKIAITNFDYQMKYPYWNVVAQHPNLNNVTQAYNLTYKPLLYQPSSGGSVQGELILGKDKKEFTWEEGWGFPWKVYFNGDECRTPSPDSYPSLPKSPTPIVPSLFAIALFFILLAFLSSWWDFRIQKQRRQRQGFLLIWKNNNV